MNFITSNKFFFTGYGKKPRKMFSELIIEKIIDFEQVEVFEDILVSSVILQVRNTKAEEGNTFFYEQFYKMKKGEFIAQFLKRQDCLGQYTQKYIRESEWSFANMSSLVLKEKIEKDATQLALCNGVEIHRGVTTGYNPAFIISDEMKDDLISKDENNGHIIKKLLQGRNIRKWYYNESEENLIFTRRGVDINKYPFILKHLSVYYNKLKPKTAEDSEEGRKPGNYKWYEILDNTAYYKEFEQPKKIIWGLTADKWAFTLDEEQHYLPSNGYILTSATIPIEYILGLLNSKIMHYYFHFIGVMTAGGAYTLKAATISALPFRLMSNPQPIISLVHDILAAKRANASADTSLEERAIDLLVYHLYGLTYEEVLLVDPVTPITRAEYETACHE